MSRSQDRTGLWLLLAGAAAAGAVTAWLIVRRREPADDCNPGRAAQREGEGRVRSAGPEGMRSKTRREWTKVDEAVDESFPASDPPGSY